MARCKYLSVNDIYARALDNLPSFDASGSIKGMKKLYYGAGALLVRSGAYIYNVTTRPVIYRAH